MESIITWNRLNCKEVMPSLEINPLWLEMGAQLYFFPLATHFWLFIGIVSLLEYIEKSRFCTTSTLPPSFSLINVTSPKITYFNWLVRTKVTTEEIPIQQFKFGSYISPIFRKTKKCCCSVRLLGHMLLLIKKFDEIRLATKDTQALI